MSKILRKVYRFLLIILVIGLFLFLFSRYYAVNGELKVAYDFCDEPNLISEFEPAGRALERVQNVKTKECYQNIAGEPVYFTVNVPRSFNQAEVTLDYRNLEQSIIELGLQKSAEWNFELKPIQNKFIDDSQWHKLQKENIILLQQNKDYENVDAFLENIPKHKNIAAYNYAPNYDFSINNYQARDNILEVNNALRGWHEFYTYVEGEDLDFTFIWDDINWINAEDDDFIVKVYKDEAEIFNGSSDNIVLTDLSGGLYKIVVDVSDDIFIRQIKTKQRYLVVKDKLFLAANEAYQQTLPDLKEEPSNIYSNSDEFIINTNHESGLQTVLINDEEFDINKISRPFKWKKDEDDEISLQKTLITPRNDVLIQGYGYFAFTQDSFFDPDYGIDELRSDIDIEKYDYIVAADYNAPKSKNSWLTATQKFDLTGVPGDRKTLNFVISAPGLDSVEDIAVREISIIFNRESLWKRLKNRFTSS